jgi:hypothetical protein
MKWATCAAAMVQTTALAMCVDAGAVRTMPQAMCAAAMVRTTLPVMCVGAGAALTMHPAMCVNRVVLTTHPATFANLAVQTMLYALKPLSSEQLRTSLRAIVSQPASAAPRARRWRGLIGSGGTGFDDVTPLPATLALVRSVTKSYHNDSELNTKYTG